MACIVLLCAELGLLFSVFGIQRNTIEDVFRYSTQSMSKFFPLMWLSVVTILIAFDGLFA